jgi:hypothetical protein
MEWDWSGQGMADGECSDADHDVLEVHDDGWVDG